MLHHCVKFLIKIKFKKFNGFSLYPVLISVSCLFFFVFLYRYFESM